MTIIDKIASLFRRKREPVAEILPRESKLTPEIIERLIEETGREEVFAEARRLGWGDLGAPLWVWKMICFDVQQRKPKALVIDYRLD